MGWDEFYIVFSLVLNGIALRNLYLDYSKAEDKKKWVRNAMWWAAMFTMILGPAFLTFYLLMTFGQ